jgi:uncharacterized protein YndB with AHSA1/START domain
VTVSNNVGCYLEVNAPERLTWTSALLPGFRPVTPPAEDAPLTFHFTATITLQPTDPGTMYHVRIQHADEASRHKHEAMGFHAGWGIALDQLVAYMKARTTNE